MTGCHGIDPDAGGEPSGECIGEPKQGITRGRVREVIWIRFGYLLVQHINHASPAIVVNMLVERANQQHRRLGVDVHVGVPALGVDAVDVIVSEQGCVVDEATQRTQTAGPRDQRCCSLGVREVGLDGNGAATSRVDLSDDLCSIVLRTAVVYGDRVTFSRQTQ